MSFVYIVSHPISAIYSIYSQKRNGGVQNVQEKDLRSNFGGNHRIADPEIKEQGLN